MANRSPVPRQLKRVLDTVHLGILELGEWRRAARGQGEAPDWIPCPDVDDLYSELEPEQWHQVPTEPDREAMEWRDAVLLNHTDLVEPLVAEALRRLGFDQPPDGVAWRRFLRVALVVAADAHAIDADRERGQYGAGYPLECSVSAETLVFLSPKGPVAKPPAPGLPPSYAPGAVKARRHSTVPSPDVEYVDGCRVRAGVAGPPDPFTEDHKLESSVPSQQRLRGGAGAMAEGTPLSLAQARTGRRKPGQRSSRDLVIQETLHLAAARERGEDGVRHRSVTDLSKQLQDWLSSAHPAAPQMKFESIARALRDCAADALAVLCPIDPTQDGARGHARASPPARTD